VTPTPSQTVGPFLHLGLSQTFGNELVPPDAQGALRMFGSVLDGAGEPVRDALVEVWAAGGGFGRSDTVGGRFSFVIAKPKRDVDAPHLEVVVFARGLLKQAVTRMYFPDEHEANDADPVLSAVDPARRRTLVAVEDDDGLRFDVHLQGADETVFFAL
jgi:protocatechuate 3,4-dioxygenase alpha subunit